MKHPLQLVLSQLLTRFYMGSTSPLVEHRVFLRGLNIWLIVGSSNIGLAFGRLNVCRPLPQESRPRNVLWAKSRSASPLSSPIRRKGADQRQNNCHLDDANASFEDEIFRVVVVCLPRIRWYVRTYIQLYNARTIFLSENSIKSSVTVSTWSTCINLYQLVSTCINVYQLVYQLVSTCINLYQTVSTNFFGRT